VQEALRTVEKKFLDIKHPPFGVGDSVSVSLRIREGEKERVQIYKGTVIQIRGTGTGKTFTVRKSSGNVYVERIFPLYSPLIAEIKRTRQGKVRRAKLFYLRGLSGKSTRIKES
jgi:large subunit ribosomal protein L19